MPILTSTKTAQNVADAVKRQFGDESGAQINDDDIIRWINEGQLDIASTTKYTKTTTSTPSVATQEQYSLPGVNIIGIDGVYYNGIPLQQRQKVEVEELILQTQDPANPTIQPSTPTLWYEYDDSIYLYPPPLDSGKTIKLFASVLPAAISNLTDFLSIPDTYYTILTDFVLARAYELDDDLQSANYKEKSMLSKLGELDDLVSERTYPVITVLMEDQ